jgi:thiol:disulfide interchange protein DsbC
MPHRRLLLIAPLLGLPGPAVAAEASGPPPPPASLADADALLNGPIEGLKALPIHGLQLVKAGGKTFLMSSNGRFVIQGTLLDVWNQVAIADLADVDRIANRIDLAKMKLRIDDLAAVTVGTGKPPVVVFVDPRCPYCKQVQQQLLALKDRYTFKLVAVPVLGPESQNLVVRLSCLAQTPHKDQARAALLQQAYDRLPAEVAATCDRQPLQRALVTAHLFGIDAVPFLIAPDGRTFKGAPENLADWLAGKPPAASPAATAGRAAP